MENHASTATPPSTSRVPTVALGIASALLLVCIIWCFVSWHTPRRFVFLPGGDVGLGFLSHGGWVTWVEYAPWMPDPDYRVWSVHWGIVIPLQVMCVVWLIRTVRRPTQHRR